MADTLRFDITQKPDFAAFERVLKAQRKPFYAAAAKIVVLDIVEGINAHRGMDGPFPALEESTIKKKGHNMQLIDRGLFGDFDTYNIINQGNNDSATITIKPLSKPREIIRKLKSGKWTSRGRSAPRGSTAAQKQEFRKKNYDAPRDFVGFVLQSEGVGKKKKHFNFFGISKDSEFEILELMQDVVALSLGAV